VSIHRLALLVITLLAAALVGCGGRAYVADDTALGALGAAAETQSDGIITVSATVPGREQVRALFGLDLYAQGIQPVWLEIKNDGGGGDARFAPVSTDRYYFSPLEVAYMNRGGYSKKGKADMERRFYSTAMPRYIGAGETRSGFVFTHLDNGAKGFNVDVYAEGKAYLFTFLMRVPGFEPDYANVDFGAIYAPAEIATLDDVGLYESLKELPCCTTNGRSGEHRFPVNIVLVGEGEELLRALLQSGWVETAASETSARDDDYYFGRRQDAIFRYDTLDRGSSYELRLWLAPVTADGERVWVGQVRHFFTLGGALRRADADVDNARNLAAQKFLYGQAIERTAWLSGTAVVPVESFWDRLIGAPYFTDGYRIALWLTNDPVATQDIDYLQWDRPPEWIQ